MAPVWLRIRAAGGRAPAGPDVGYAGGPDARSGRQGPERAGRGGLRWTTSRRADGSVRPREGSVRGGIDEVLGSRSAAGRSPGGDARLCGPGSRRVCSCRVIPQRCCRTQENAFTGGGLASEGGRCWNEVSGRVRACPRLAPGSGIAPASARVGPLSPANGGKGGNRTASLPSAPRVHGQRISVIRPSTVGAMLSPRAKAADSASNTIRRTSGPGGTVMIARSLKWYPSPPPNK